ncbi:RNA-binding protein [Candidatus Bathyarchaeota archaeon]|nr:RNA-binding protein [Candidatus Bathyarchaeota archaeon]
MSGKKLAIAIPTSFISDTPHLREKTAKVGLIGRAAAVFRVDEIIVFLDTTEKSKQKKEADFIMLLLSYLETPQYLRKRFFKLDSRLQYAGILPPLRTPHHPLNRKSRKLKVGEYREGVTVSKTREGVLVDIGVEHPALMRENQWGLGKRLTLQVVAVDERIEVQAVGRDQVSGYWGYRVKLETHSFGSLVENGKFDLVIATSKIGIRFEDTAEKMGEHWRKADYKLVSFGAPARGLHEIAKDEGFDLNDLADYVVNMVPNQGTETVRTEEALFASLAVFNVQFGW